MFILTKKIVFNADDLGLFNSINRAVLEAYEVGLLISASLVANGMFVEDVVNNILPKCQNLGIGVHLNITEGYSLCTDLEILADSQCKFKNTFLKILYLTYKPDAKKFMEELEREFRRQIEFVMSKTNATHIDSHEHIHSIPKIFDLVCRLAKEYGIKEVRTHFEKLYIVPDFQKYMSIKYYKNITKLIMLNFFTLFNDVTIQKYELSTNDYIIGILYSSLIDALTISYGTMAVNHKNIRIEVLLHPSRYDDGTINNYFNEYLLIKNKKLKDKIEQMGFEITNYVEKET